MRTRPALGLALAAALLPLGGSCQLVNAIAACEEALAPAAEVNRRSEGDQLIASPGSVAALPTGDALVLWTSDGGGTAASELRAVRVNAEGVSQPGCARVDGGEDTLAGDAAILRTAKVSAVLSAPSGPTTMGLFTFLETSPLAIRAGFFNANGCVDFLAPASTRVFPVAEGAPGHVLRFNTSVSVAKDGINERFAVFWEDVDTRTLNHMVKARLVSRDVLAPAFPASAADPTGGAVTLPVRHEALLGLDAAAISPHEVALLMVGLSVERQSIQIWLARFDDTLAPLGEPVLVADAVALPTIVPLRQALLATDGDHLFVMWMALDPATQTTRAFGQAFDPRGRPVERPVRLGTAAVASDSHAAVTAHPGGGFVTAWREQGSGGVTLRARALDTFGRPAFNSQACGDADFAFAEAGAQGDLGQPSLTFLSSGSLLGAWDGVTPGSRDPDGHSVRSRLFSPRALFPGGVLRSPTAAPVAPAPLAQPPPVTERPCGQPEARSPGAACGCDLTCANDAFCGKQESVGDPGGTCYIRCDTDAGCPAGSVCSRSDGLCTAACTEHADCPAGRECFLGSCIAHCQSDAVCGTATCDPYTRRCAVQNNGAGGLYARCTRAADCHSGHCGIVYPEIGRCWSSCWPSQGGCPEGAVCVEWTPGGKDWGSCLLPCPDGVCPAGLTCERYGAKRLLVCTAGRP